MSYTIEKNEEESSEPVMKTDSDSKTDSSEEDFQVNSVYKMQD